MSRLGLWKRQAVLCSKAYAQSLLSEGAAFRKAVLQIEDLESKGEAYRQEFQLRALRRVTRHAADTIPHWRETFPKCGIDPDRISSVEELQRLPLLTKTEVNANPTAFLSESAKRWGLSKGMTSGTTGSPGIFYRDLQSIVFENATIWHVRRKVGMEPGCRLAVLRGESFIPSAQREPPFWLRNFGGNSLLVSSYHLIPEYKHEILDAIERFAPSGAFVYPSSAFVLANWCRELDRPLPFSNINTSSETVLEGQRDVIASVLPGRWIDHYGQAERVCFFASFDGGNFQDFTEYGVTELYDREDRGFEVVGSTLHNLAMPLFRYCTGDFVQSRTQSGDDRPVIKGLLGRKEDFVKLADGALIGRLDLVFKGLEGIREAQIHQDKRGRLEIRVVPGPGYSDSMETKLITNARERMDHNIDITIVRTDHIPRSKSGKFKFVESEYI